MRRLIRQADVGIWKIHQAARPDHHQHPMTMNARALLERVATASSCVYGDLNSPAHLYLASALWLPTTRACAATRAAVDAADRTRTWAKRARVCAHARKRENATKRGPKWALAMAASTTALVPLRCSDGPRRGGGWHDDAGAAVATDAATAITTPTAARDSRNHRRPECHPLACACRLYTSTLICRAV